MKKKILVVDNNPLLLKFMTTLLTKEGHQLRTAEDGLSALDILMTYIPDIMFIDLIMPNINGEQLCRIIRKMPALKDTYAVILSATMAEKPSVYTELGANAFIVKGPFNKMAVHVLAMIEQSDHDIPMGDQNKIMGSGAYTRQITKELLSAKGHLEAILRNISDALIELASDGRIIFANPAGVSLMGFSEEALLGSKFTELIDEGDRKRIEDSLMRIDEGSQKIDLDTPLIVNSRQVLLSMLSVKEDVRSSIILVIKDITERKRAERVLRESEEKYRSMMEAMDDPVYIGSSDFSVAYMNPSMIKLIGNDVTGEPCHKALFDKEEKCPWCIHDKVQQGESAETEIVNPKNNRSYNVIHSPIFHEDGSISKMTILRDTTMAKHLEAQLFRSERLSATGQLAVTVAHEINSPLQGITSLLYSIERSYGQDEKLLEKLNLVTRGFTGIRDIVKKLLDLNRPGKEKKQPTNINNVIEDTMALLKNHLKANNIKIVLNLSSKMPHITASPQQLGQVFMNLINNAVEAITGTSKSKDIFKTRENINGKITISSDLGKDTIIIDVADTGPGISEEDLEHIFDPFYTRKKEKGIGIGLSLCHGIIEDHNGFITAKNSPEGGSIFQITLPIR